MQLSTFCVGPIFTEENTVDNARGGGGGVKNPSTTTSAALFCSDGRLSNVEAALIISPGWRDRGADRFAEDELVLKLHHVAYAKPHQIHNHNLIMITNIFY